MKCDFLVALVLAIPGQALAVDDVGRARSLKVQYIGNKDTDRGRSYTKFLSDQFVLVAAVDRKTYDPGSVADVDVVVLDWSQSDIDRSGDPGAKPRPWRAA